MPEMTGPELQEELGKADNCLPIIFISAYGDVPTTARAMKRGAVDFLTKPVDGDNLLAVISEAMARDAESRALRAETETFLNHLATLTAREHEVLTHVIGGKLNKQIALELNISETTVKIHRGRVMRKLRINSLPELARMCEKAGITPMTSSQEGQQSIRG
jgi:FixJ family two-component response regulator